MIEDTNTIYTNRDNKIYFKSLCIVDGKPKWIYLDENYNKIGTPTKEQRKLSVITKGIRHYNDTNTCTNIKETGTVCGNRLEPAIAYKEKNEEGKWTGRWICINCWKKYYNKRPNCGNNIMRELAGFRTGYQDPNSNSAKGRNYEKLTCIWLKVDNLNIKYDNCEVPIDHSPISEKTIISIGGKYIDLIGMIPQTQGRLYRSFYKYWSFSGLEREWNKKFDIMIYYCLSKDGKTVERIYILPKEEIIRRKGICIVKNPTDPHGNSKSSWYDDYRVADENTIRQVNNIWKMLT